MRTRRLAFIGAQVARRHGLRTARLVVPGVAALLALASPARAGEEVTLQEVPAPVRETIQKHVQNGKLESIERETEKGKPTVYEVEYEANDGKEFELKIGADGKLLSKEED